MGLYVKLWRNLVIICFIIKDFIIMLKVIKKKNFFEINIMYWFEINLVF